MEILDNGLIIGLLLAVLYVCGSHGDCNGGRTRLEPDDDPQTISSPGYPAQYPENQACHWTIYEYGKNVMITFLDIDLENDSLCREDNLTLYGYDYEEKRRFKVYILCGSATPNYTLSFRGSVAVYFKSNNQTSGRGFMIQYQEIREDDDDDDNKEHGTDKWGGVVIAVCVVVGVALVVTLVLVIFCSRRQRATAGKRLGPVVSTSTDKSRDTTGTLPDSATVTATYLGKTDLV